MENKKKKISIIILILLLMVVSWIGIFIFFNTDEEGERVPLKDYLPFGSPSDSDRDPDRDPGDLRPRDDGFTIGDDGTIIIPRLRQISTEPVAGTTLFTENERDGSVLRYIQRANGHINEAYTHSIDTNRVSNTTVQYVYQALWASTNQNSLILRQLDESRENIVSKQANIINTDEGLAELALTNLPINILEIDTDPEREKIFALSRIDTRSIGTISDLTGLNSTRVFSSDLSQWLVDWSARNTISLTTKPSANVEGNMYFLNTTTGQFSNKIKNINGLTTLTNRDASRILYSQNRGGQLTLNMHNVENNSSFQLPVRTLPEKCVWSKTSMTKVYCAVPNSNPIGNLPDVWYQGKIFFSYSLYEIDAETGEAENIAQLNNKSGQNIDVINLSITEDDEFIIFSNKRDLSLWLLKTSPGDLVIETRNGEEENGEILPETED